MIMAERIENFFTSWSFSGVEEELQAKFLKPGNYEHVQNSLAEAAQAKMLVAFNPDSQNASQEFAGEHEYWRGYMAALNTLLNQSKDAQVELDTLQQEQLDLNQTKHRR